jgi:hypothetical protein
LVFNQFNYSIIIIKLNVKAASGKNNVNLNFCPIYLSIFTEADMQPFICKLQRMKVSVIGGKNHSIENLELQTATSLHVENKQFGLSGIMDNRINWLMRSN